MTRRLLTWRSFIPLSVLLVALAALPGRLAAQDGEIGIAIEPAGSAGDLSKASQGANFSVPPSTNSAVQTYDLIIRCFNIATGQIIPNCNVSLVHRARARSGGHDHDDAARPKGTFNPASGNTGPSGQLLTTYTAPQVSGIIDVSIPGTTPDGRPVVPGTLTMGVEVTNLVPLGVGTNYILIGATPTHGDNHYGTPAFNGALRTLADSYAAAFPGQRLAYNDMSLRYGGLFDIRAGWAPPHASHRLGVDLDLRLVPAQQRRRLRQLITGAGIRTILVEGDHWHIRQ